MFCQARPHYHWVLWFDGGTPSQLITTLPSLVAMVVVVVKIWYFQLLKKEIPNALASIRHYCLPLKDMAWKRTACHINNPDPQFIIFWDFSMFYQTFFSPQVKRCAIIAYKHGIYELPNELPNDLRLRILEN